PCRRAAPVTDAIAGATFEIVAVVVTVSARPRTSRTMSRTLNRPSWAYVGDTVGPVSVAPSPKLQRYVSASPSGSVDPAPLMGIGGPPSDPVNAPFTAATGGFVPLSRARPRHIPRSPEE